MLFQMILKQLAIVSLILAALPLVISLLWKLRLLPLAVSASLPYLMGQTWAAEHERLRLCLLAASVVFAVLAWVLRIRRWRREQRYYEHLLLATAKPLNRITEQGEIVPVGDDE